MKFIKKPFLLVILLFPIVLAMENIMAEEVKPNKTKDNLDIFTLGDVPGSDITVIADQEFFIRIKANISAGYGWEVVQPLEKDKLTFIEKTDETEADEYESGEQKLVGAPGFQILKFKALSPGKSIIFLELVRPWEKGVQPQKKHKINVTIE